MTCASSLSEATAAFTRPSAAARLPVTGSPVSMSSSAREAPTARGLRGLRGVAQIAGARDLAAAAHGKAIDDAYRRHRRTPKRIDSGVDRAVVLRARSGIHALTLLEISAGAERATGAADKQHTRRS